MTLPRTLPSLLLLLALAAPLRAQEVRLEGRGDSRAVRLAREVLAAGNYLRMDRDTVLPPDFRRAGDLVVVDADVRLEGTVEGRIAVLGGVLYIRPGARVGGTIANVGGEVYPSGLATVGEIVEDSLPRQVAVAFDTAGAGTAATVTLVPPPGEGPRLALPGIGGLRLPSYDRVNGFTLTAGPAFLFTGREGGPRVDGWVSYHTARGDFGGGVSARTPLGAGIRAEARAERGWQTNERWHRGDLVNTLASLSIGSDQRDYYDSDRATLTLTRVHEEPLIAGEYAFEPRLSAGAFRDRALEARDPWSLFGDLDRPNLPVSEVSWTSAALGAAFRWQGGTTSFAGDAQVEQALPFAGDFDFTQWTVDGLWTMQALHRHAITVRFRGMGTWGGEPALRQRWSFLGGPSTLPTLETAELRGDRLAYVRSGYGIPIPRVVLPVLGFPTVQLTHVTGTAWQTGRPMPDWAQNLGVELVFSLVRAGVFVDPAADGLDPTLSLSAELPFF